MQESNKIEIKPGVELKFRYGMAAPDSRPGFKGYHWGDVRVLSVRGQNVDLEQKQAGEWRNNGLVSSIPSLQHMQNEYKQMGTKSKLSKTKKTMKLSELRQIIREEIQKEIFGLEKYGRGGVQPQSFNDKDRAKEKAKELSIEDPDGSYYVVEYPKKMDGSEIYKIETSYGTEPGKKYHYEFKNGEVKTNYVINPYTNMPYTK